jgi:hypothetical protein
VKISLPYNRAVLLEQMGARKFRFCRFLRYLVETICRPTTSSAQFRHIRNCRTSDLPNLLRSQTLGPFSAGIALFANYALPDYRSPAYRLLAVEEIVGDSVQIESDPRGGLATGHKFRV